MSIFRLRSVQRTHFSIDMMLGEWNIFIYSYFSSSKNKNFSLYCLEVLNEQIIFKSLFIPFRLFKIVSNTASNHTEIFFCTSFALGIIGSRAHSTQMRTLLDDNRFYYFCSIDFGLASAFVPLIRNQFKWNGKKEEKRSQIDLTEKVQRVGCD